MTDDKTVDVIPADDKAGGLLPVTNHCVFFGVSRGMLIFRGIILAILGLLLISSPLMTGAFALTITIGAIMLINGIVALISILKAPPAMKGMLALYGIILVLFGLCAVFFPLQMDVFWLYFLAFWMLLDAVTSFIMVFSKANGTKVLSFFSGLLSLALAIMFLSWPLASLSSLYWLLGIIVLTYALLLLFGAFKQK